MLSSGDYPIPAAMLEHEILVRKSRFIARACPARDRAEAMTVVQTARSDHPDARHHCWAYSIGPPHSAATAGMSDDGEPSGTAGKPIMNVITHRGIGDIVVVVIRYFGGVKLGAGGLVRAYSTATQQAVERLVLTERQPACRFQAQMDFPVEEPLRRWAQMNQAAILAVDYGQQVLMTLELPLARRDELQAFAAARRITLRPA